MRADYQTQDCNFLRTTSSTSFYLRNSRVSALEWANHASVHENHGPWVDNFRPGARFSKVPIINGPGKLSPFTLKIEVSIVLHLTLIKLSVNETKWSSLLGLSRNGPQKTKETLACSRRSDSRAQRSVGVLESTARKRLGGGGGGETSLPLSPSSLPSFFFSSWIFLPRSTIGTPGTG